MATLSATTTRLVRPGEDAEVVAPSVLGTVSRASRECLLLHVRYRDARGHETERRLEPLGIVSAGRRWYLVARDQRRGDWRTFRLDRVVEARDGHGFVRVDVPDPVGVVQRAITTVPTRHQADIELDAPLAEVGPRVPPTAGIVEALDDGRTLLTTGADDLDLIVFHVLRLGVPFRVRRPDALRQCCVELGARLLAAAAGPDGTDAPASRRRPWPTACSCREGAVRGPVPPPCPCPFGGAQLATQQVLVLLLGVRVLPRASRPAKRTSVAPAAARRASPGAGWSLSGRWYPIRRDWPHRLAGLGHHPLKVAARVRIPLGLLNLPHRVGRLRTDRTRTTGTRTWRTTSSWRPSRTTGGQRGWRRRRCATTSPGCGASTSTTATTDDWLAVQLADMTPSQRHYALRAARAWGRWRGTGLGRTLKTPKVPERAQPTATSESLRDALNRSGSEPWDVRVRRGRGDVVGDGHARR